MASAIIHLCVANEVGKRLNINDKNLLLGSIAPDIGKLIDKDKKETHFISIKEDIPNIDYFLSKYKKYMKNPFELGYFIHLYTDKLWFEDYSLKIFCDNSLKLKDGTIIPATSKYISKIIYNDYSNLNVELIDKYSLDLDLFYEDIKLDKTYIENFPISKIKLLVDKMGSIIVNSKSKPTYVLDLVLIEDFINTSVDIIVNKIKEIQSN